MVRCMPDFAIARSRVRLPSVAAVYQRQLSAIPPGSVNEYQRKLGSKRAYHAMHCPVSVVLKLRLVSGCGLQETEISAALWALEARERTLLFTYSVAI